MALQATAEAAVRARAERLTDGELLWQARPLELRRAAAALEGHLAAVGPAEEAAFSCAAVPVLTALVWRVLLDSRRSGILAATTLGHDAGRENRRGRRLGALALLFALDRYLRCRKILVQERHALETLALDRIAVLLGLLRGRLAVVAE